MRRPGAEGMDCHRPRGLSRFPKIGWSRVLEWRDVFYRGRRPCAAESSGRNLRGLRVAHAQVEKPGLRLGKPV